jgi:hypothetical protein
MSFKGTLLFALYAVGLTLIFLSHYDPPITALSKLWEHPEARVRMRSPYPRTRSQAGISRLTRTYLALNSRLLGPNLGVSGARGSLRSISRVSRTPRHPRYDHPR